MDWKWTVTAVLPVVTLILGSWLTQVNERRRDEGQLHREERAHELERARQQRDRQEEFELTSLGDLLKAITGLTAAAVKVRESRSGFASEEMQRYEELNGQVNALSGLVLDDTARSAVDQLHKACTHLILATHVRFDQRPTRDQILELGQLHGAVTAMLTERIRKIYLGRAI